MFVIRCSFLREETREILLGPLKFGGTDQASIRLAPLSERMADVDDNQDKRKQEPIGLLGQFLIGVSTTVAGALLVHWLIRRDERISPPLDEIGEVGE